MKRHVIKTKRNYNGASLITFEKELTKNVRDRISILERQGYALIDSVDKGLKTVYRFTKKQPKYANKL